MLADPELIGRGDRSGGRHRRGGARQRAHAGHAAPHAPRLPRHLPGHRALGRQPRRSRQPTPGRLRPPAPHARPSPRHGRGQRVARREKFGPAEDSSSSTGCCISEPSARARSGRDAAYEPLEVADDRAIAFVRGGDVAVVVPRLSLRGRARTAVALPPGEWRRRVQRRRCRVSESTCCRSSPSPCWSAR